MKRVFKVEVDIPSNADLITVAAEIAVAIGNIDNPRLPPIFVEKIMSAGWVVWSVQKKDETQ